MYMPSMDRPEVYFGMRGTLGWPQDLAASGWALPFEENHALVHPPIGSMDPKIQWMSLKIIIFPIEKNGGHCTPHFQTPFFIILWVIFP